MKNIKDDKKLLSYKKLPIIITKYSGRFPFSISEKDLNNKIYNSTVKVALNYFNGNIIFAHEKKKISPDKNINISNVYKVATHCKIQKNYEGHYQIFFSGITRVELKQIISENNNEYYSLYEEIKDIYGDYDQEKKYFLKILALVDKKFSKTIEGYPHLLNPNLHITHHSVVTFMYAISYTFCKNVEEFQKIISENNVIKRLALINKMLINNLKQQDFDKEINSKINSNISKAQREFFIREKIKLLKKELGEVSGKENYQDKILKTLQSKQFPKNIKEKILEELKKVESMAPISAEASVIRNYIDWLIDLPWINETINKNSIPKIKKILDKNHYGLKLVKERILEYLAVSEKTKKNQGIILCLSGPPGVGKTSLARSIAEAINRNFIKVSLGGIKDESEIRGHRRTYIGSMPGRIIQGMKRSRVINPLFLLDEIDKLSSDYKGDPASALLEVLDPEQNYLFSDHYIEEPYDLSKVLFITTANMSAYIPPALKDRLEIIELHSYTELEKLKIAKNYLMKKIFEKHGLKKTDLLIDSKIILKIIRHYTLEAGVRNLERELSKICRKVVVEQLSSQGKLKKIKVNESNLFKYLGVEKYNFTAQNKKSLIGVATGLAWTNFGGDILPIEATLFEGKGDLKLTGNLGNVMKESADISLSYLKSNVEKYKIPNKVFKSDIHIHAPEGAIPKDGPSAGITITTAVLSMLRKVPISKDIAMTGEITLQGHILPIGGLKEKLISATRSKIKIVFIPKENIKNLIDIPEEILNSLKILPVENYSQVYEYLFEKNKSIDFYNIFTDKKYFSIKNLIT